MESVWGHSYAIINTMTDVHMFWDGMLTKYQVASMLSFKEHGFTVNLWSLQTYDLPDGIVARDASELVPADFLKTYSMDHWAVKPFGQHEAARILLSDYFRVAVLATHGGWWADCDTFCLKDAADYDALLPGKKICAGYVNNSGEINNCIIAIPNQAIADKLKIDIEDRLAQKTHFTFGELGFQLLNSFVPDNDLLSDIVPVSAFFPHKDDASDFWSIDADLIDELEQISQGSHAVHWLNSQPHLGYNVDGTLKPTYISRLIETLNDKTPLDSYQ